MKKKDQNLLEKKKKPVNQQQKDKIEEMSKDKKIISPISASEKSNPATQRSNNPKQKKINNLTDLPSSRLSRKKSEQKYKIGAKILDEKM